MFTLIDECVNPYILLLILFVDPNTHSLIDTTTSPASTAPVQVTILALSAGPTESTLASRTVKEQVLKVCRPSDQTRSWPWIGTSSGVIQANGVAKSELPATCQSLLTGRRVEVIDASGNKVTGPDGPFYLWDGCEACSTDGHMDMSGGSPTSFIPH